MSAAEAATDPPAPAATAATRKEKQRERKKQRRRRARREAAALARAAAEALPADPEEERRLRELQEAEAEASDRARREFEEAERRWLEAAAARAAEAAAAQQEATVPGTSSGDKHRDGHAHGLEGGGEWEYVEDGPAEIIWQGNEITVKKKMVKVPKKAKDKLPIQEEDRPTSNPLPPQSVAFTSQKRECSLSAQEVLDKVAQETPNFGTEQDKAHCPFHLKTGACRFGVRCSRVHFYPDKSCTLLMKNMYNGPGLFLEQDEGLEFTDEEIEQKYEEFYEDVHTEFLKFGELINFKVCRNGSVHLRGNVYVHYKSLDSALLAYNSMNGRYFAGKQITCEFVALTRWKAAICGEFMRSRFKTCSHGVACNFIHCFRNPGGDYEWADWDNSPPKHWARKMNALFGPSDNDVHRKASDTPDFERSQSSYKKRQRSSSDRYVSNRSRDEDAHKRNSLRDYSHSKQGRMSHSMKYEPGLHRREPSVADKHRGQVIEDYTDKSSTVETKREPYRHMHEERRRSLYGDVEKVDTDEIRYRKRRSERQESLEPGISDCPSYFDDTYIRKSPSNSKPTDNYDTHKNRRQSLEDPTLESYYLTSHLSIGKVHSTKRSSRRCIEDDCYDERDGGRRESGKHKEHHAESNDRWVATNSDVDSDVDSQYERSSSRGRKLGRKDIAYSDVQNQYQWSSSRTSKLAEDDKSSRKRKHNSESRKHRDKKDDASDSDTRDLSSDAGRSRSRSSGEDLSLHRSRKRRGHRSHDS